MAEMTPQQKAEAEADNAKTWAEAFCETFPDCGLDWGTMVGWFAMAIELSSDKRIPKAVEQERELCIDDFARAVSFHPDDVSKAYRAGIANIRARGKEGK